MGGNMGPNNGGGNFGGNNSGSGGDDKNTTQVTIPKDVSSGRVFVLTKLLAKLLKILKQFSWLELSLEKPVDESDASVWNQMLSLQSMNLFQDPQIV